MTTLNARDSLQLLRKASNQETRSRHHKIFLYRKASSTTRILLYLCVLFVSTTCFQHVHPMTPYSDWFWIYVFFEIHNSSGRISREGTRKTRASCDKNSEVLLDQLSCPVSFAPLSPRSRFSPALVSSSFKTDSPYVSVMLNLSL